MQLMPATMRRFGIDRNATVEEQLDAGGKLLVLIDSKLAKTIPDSQERINFVLACYNSGLSKVMDYRERAQKSGYDPNVWVGNVERFSTGQTIAFVKEVNKRYSHYKLLIE